MGASAGRAYRQAPLTAQRPSLYSRINFFFGPELGLYQLRSPPQRSILEHVSICSPSSDPHRLLFFGPEPERNSTSGITHGRKTVSPSRNPCNSDHFLVATHNRCSPSSDPHRFFFYSAGVHSSNFGTPSRSSCERACRLEVFASVFFSYACLALHGLY